MNKSKVKFDIAIGDDAKLIPTKGNAIKFANSTGLINYIREAGIAGRIRNLFILPVVLQNLARTPLVKSFHGQRGELA